MTQTPEPRESRKRRVPVLAGIALVVLVAGGATIAWSAAQQGAGDTAANGSADSLAGAPGAPGAGREPSDAVTELADFSAHSDGVAAQLSYAYEHWTDTESDTFGFLPENDCANFTSQTLIARGWVEDDEWWFDESGDAYTHATAWISSTAMRDYLEEHPERATALTDDERSEVKAGDVVQFDWDDSGDRDHTGIVTSVETGLDGSVTILYAGHTDPTWDRSVDWAITELHPGGVAYYWSIPE
ncbi:amidase domain-containing protein [Agromyces cerinus]|uniref:Putative amidase domain-containing protein n=1 Tax=Agromyces cerinus subsp. cerinus TaxID=232089 RepID=A0A1N6GUY3_9MICO|nr:amidase domain-containing protein [Agromyces cerinus]SIO11257.1 Putative amidase domain-containing protein [Agromyces cerinus subsp. cerinus]